LASAEKLYNFRQSKKAAESSLIEFVRQAWHIIEPGNEFSEGWHIRAICDHLEAVHNGEDHGDINRLLINVPPGCMKSLLTSVFFIAWVWTRAPHVRFLCSSHSQNLAIRDSTKTRRLIMSDWYQERWGDAVVLADDQNAKTKFENSAMGFREAVAAGSITGSRGDIVIVDDPHSVEGANSDAMRESTAEWYREALTTRLNNPERSAIITIMQRLHEEDVSGIILSNNLGYTHLCLPMEFDPLRRCETEIGFVDPRTEEGQLLFPERFPPEVVARDKHALGPYAYAGQFQQTPSPKGAGIIPRDAWVLYDEDEAAAQGMNSSSQYPPMDYVIASLDTAYSEKTSADASALTIWGVWQKSGQQARAILTSKGDRVDLIDDRDTLPCCMLMFAWAKRLPIHGPETIRHPGETDADYLRRSRLNYGLVEWVMDSCRRFNVHTLLVEAKASGISVAQEIKRLMKTADYSVQLINPGSLDKVARAYAVQAAFTGGQIYAPDREWADKVITECEQFPKGAHDDLVDSTTQALRYMRERGLLRRSDEVIAEITDRATYRKPLSAPYDV